MDKKTVILMLTQLVAIIVLVVVLGMDFHKQAPEKAAVHHEAVEEKHAEETTAPAEVKAVETAKPEVKKQEVKKAAEAPKEEVKKQEIKKEVEKTAPVKEEVPAKEKAAPAKAASAGDLDVIAMNNSAYEKHKKGIVQFTHKKHAEEYQLNCGECHHDDKGEALKDLKAGDKVDGCIACHDKAGKAPKEVKGKDKLQYHANALHANCITCHKDYNTKNNSKAAPTSCGKCHPKK